jgi:hypothetical protein
VIIAIAAIAMAMIRTVEIGNLRASRFVKVSRPAAIGAVPLEEECGAEVRAAAFASVALA